MSPLRLRGRGRGCGCALAGAALAAGILCAAVRWGAYPFLARTAPAGADALVVEGWMGDVQLEEALGWARSNGVSRIYTTGGPFELGAVLLPWTNYAVMTAARLEALGATQRVAVAGAPRVLRGRTAASAAALREAYGEELRGGFTLASQGPHTRRSWRVFRRAFGEETAEIGSLALAPQDFGPDDWWTCSAGVRTMLGEGIAYFYDAVRSPGPEEGE